MSGRWKSVCAVGSDTMGEAVILQQKVSEDGLPLDEHRVVSAGQLLPQDGDER